MEWISKNADLIAIAVALIPIIWGSVQFLLIRRAAEKDREFKIYHQLIKGLVQGDEGKDAPIYIDRQAAIIYELRRFRRYYPLTLRTLRRSMLKWKDHPFIYIGGVTPSPLLLEAELTIKYIEEQLEIESYLCNPREENEFPPKGRTPK